jgi:hypothetical protein
MGKTLQRSLSRLSAGWCQLAHPAPMWPVGGHYRCPTCLRTYRVPWEDAPACAPGRKGRGESREVAPARTVGPAAAAAATR